MGVDFPPGAGPTPDWREDDDEDSDRFAYLGAEGAEVDDESDENEPCGASSGSADYGSLLGLGMTIRRKRPCLELGAEEAENAARLVQHVAARQISGEDTLGDDIDPDGFPSSDFGWSAPSGPIESAHEPDPEAVEMPEPEFGAYRDEARPHGPPEPEEAADPAEEIAAVEREPIAPIEVEAAGEPNEEIAVADVAAERDTIEEIALGDVVAGPTWGDLDEGATPPFPVPLAPPPERDVAVPPPLRGTPPRPDPRHGLRRKLAAIPRPDSRGMKFARALRRIGRWARRLTR